MLEKQVVEAVRKVVGIGKHLLHEPLLQGNEKVYVNEVLTSGHLSAGSWVSRFEDYLAGFVGARYAIAVVNATCGLHAAISVLPKKPYYRLPSLTFVATANAVAYGGNKIRFVEHYGYTDIAVDVLGHPHFQAGAFLHDSAQAFGSKRYGRYVGSQGTCVFSFNQNKIITAGSGGIVTTDDEGVAKELRRLATTARIEHAYKTAHDAIAYNYRMSDVTAAILVAQMEQLPLILQAKRALAMQYKKIFSVMSGVTFWDEPDKAESNFWLNAIILDDDTKMIPCVEALHKVGILAKPLYEPIHRLAPYVDCERDDLSKTENLVKRAILLPSSPKLGLKYL